MNMRTLFLVAVTMAALFAADETVFVGNPRMRFDADGKATTPHEMSGEGAQKYACRIVKSGRKYIWASRDNRELIRSEAGDYTYFISPEGAGYVKIFTGKAGGKQPGSFDYLEQLSSELKTFTYWGKTTQPLSGAR